MLLLTSIDTIYSAAADDEDDDDGRVVCKQAAATVHITLIDNFHTGIID